MPLFLLVSALLTPGIASVGPEGTEVSDTVATATWTTAGQPCRVVSTVTVDSGYTLTIEPGVTVAFDADGSRADMGAFPRLDSGFSARVRDVPNDQGGTGHLQWTASVAETVATEAFIRYSIWRALEPGTGIPSDALVKRMRIGGTDYFWEWITDKPAARLASVKPVEFALEQNVPNPFNPVTTIQFGTLTDGAVRLAVYSASGQLVKTLVDRSLNAGFRPQGQFI